MNSKDFFILSIITHDERAVIQSIALMNHVAVLLADIHPNYWINVSTAGGYSMARTQILDNIHEKFPDEKEVYTFWLDSDVKITESAQHVADLIREAQKRDINFVSEYKTLVGDTRDGSFRGVTFKSYDVTYTDEELYSAKDFELKVHHSGLGLAFIKSPTRYDFWTRGTKSMEDNAFFSDNPQIVKKLYFANIDNVHLKISPLNNRKGDEQ